MIREACRYWYRGIEDGASQLRPHAEVTLGMAFAIVLLSVVMWWPTVVAMAITGHDLGDAPMWQFIVSVLWIVGVLIPVSHGHEVSDK